MDSREKLSTIRSVQGWRVAYKVANLKDEGSDATKRKRLSRAINRKTSSYKPLTKTQSKRINRSFGQRKKQIKRGRAEQMIKKIDKYKAMERRYLRGKLARGEMSEAAVNRRLRRASPLDDAQKQAIRDSAEDEDWDSYRAEYASQISTISISNIPRRFQYALERTQNKTAGALKKKKKKDSLQALTVKELKAQLKEKGLSQTGKKVDLIERLLKAGDEE